ncbi:MAG: CehA/McbA family metallohydrolase [Actinomycetota bacterium]
MRHTRVKSLLASLAVAVAIVQPVASRAAGDPEFLPLVGALHEHSGYSDGDPGATPGTYFASGKNHGIDFMFSADHSDNLDVPVTLSDKCLGPGIVTCPGGDPDPARALRKWDATLQYAREVTDENFTAARGFEWTSDRFGHINVFFSRNFANAKTDGGYAGTMESFWNWFTTPAYLQGGLDGLAVFNHPNDKKLPQVGDQDPGRNWNEFAYVAAADNRMVGIELYNTNDEYGDWYVRALDKGWHVGAIGAEDAHTFDDDWGASKWAKTVILSAGRSEAELRSAMQARRFYAVRDGDIRLTFSVDGAIMGSRLQRAPGQALVVKATTNRSDLTLDLITSGGDVVVGGTSSIDAPVVATPDDKYYFVRARDAAGNAVAFSSPVWIEATPAGTAGEWLAGDLHVHTCASHDVWCGPDDDNTGMEEFYTFGGSVEERFIEASIRGLDYLAITDHQRPESSQDPGFGTHGVIGVPGYENSIHGHAQMLGATHTFDAGDENAPAVQSMVDALRAEGGVFQANHPADNIKAKPFACEDTDLLHWKYGYDVQPDTIEVWNIAQWFQPPFPSATSNEDAGRYWECWLNRGAHIGATGGSDSHWLTLSAFQGVGNPTTWVFTRERSARGILAGVREGRTSISMVPPAYGRLRLILEADADGDGVFESMIGDTVPRGVKMRARAEGLPPGGVVDIRANGGPLLTGEPLIPGGAVTFTSPPDAGWVRAILMLPDGTAERGATCDSTFGGSTTYCRNRVLVAALTSAIYMS